MHRRLRLHLRPSEFLYRWRRRMRQECCRLADQQGLAIAKAQRDVNAPPNQSKARTNDLSILICEAKMDRERFTSQR
jgi:hypothetical protein